MTPKRTTTQRVHLVPPAPAPQHAPWWLPVASGAVAGGIAVSVGLLLTAGTMPTPDTFAMTLIGGGIALVAGVNTRILARALGPAARALTEAERERDR